ncbi:hypothetical protein EWM64_g8432 [Hericium alpestre]|uniref:Uncharacterized protein n=1 Tax=Hericium alpestre TaxID=135208 RepID=A0A4Y9ZMV4_9AGAM|nr:hypothetical protein EWM64_g8432 [Hericium alpestre]
MDPGDDSRSDAGSTSSGSSDARADEMVQILMQWHPRLEVEDDPSSREARRLLAFHDAMKHLLKSYNQAHDGPKVEFLERYQLKVDLMFKDVLIGNLETGSRTDEHAVSYWKGRIEKLRVKLKEARDRLEQTRKIHYMLSGQLETWQKTFEITMTQLTRSIDRWEKLGVKLRDALIDLNNLSGDVPLTQSLRK